MGSCDRYLGRTWHGIVDRWDDREDACIVPHNPADFISPRTELDVVLGGGVDNIIEEICQWLCDNEIDPSLYVLLNGSDRAIVFRFGYTNDAIAFKLTFSEYDVTSDWLQS